MRRRWGPPLAVLVLAALLLPHTRSILLALSPVSWCSRSRDGAVAVPVGCGAIVAVGFFVQGLQPHRAAHALHGERTQEQEENAKKTGGIE